ncbi:MAG: MerR family DNA-binding transcriptional regulator [Rhodospirillaceae bacterium]
MITSPNRPKGEQADTLYSTNQLADSVGVTQRTIRFYESKGLLRPQFAGSTRVYTYRDHARLELILRGKRLGFSLDEIAEYLALYDADPEHISQVRHIRAKANERANDLKAKLSDIKITLGELEQIKQDAAHWLAEKGVPLEVDTPIKSTIK